MRHKKRHFSLQNPLSHTIFTQILAYIKKKTENEATLSFTIDDGFVYFDAIPNGGDIILHNPLVTALDQTNQEPRVNSQMLIKDGQLFILRGDKTYTVTGQEVR